MDAISSPLLPIASFSAPFTLWLSMMAALGLASRLLAARDIECMVDAIESAVATPQY
jgi:hypothetical protein